MGNKSEKECLPYSDTTGGRVGVEQPRVTFLMVVSNIEQAVWEEEESQRDPCESMPKESASSAYHTLFGPN